MPKKKHIHDGLETRADDSSPRAWNRIRQTGREIRQGIPLFLLPEWVTRKLGLLQADSKTAWYPKKQRESGMSLRPSTRWVLALGPVVIGFWIALNGRADAGGIGVGVATRNFLTGIHGPLYWSALWFWAVVLLWTRALFIRLREEDRADDRYREDLMGALYSLPNLDVLWNYRKYYDPIAELVLGRELPSTTTELGNDIKLALAAIAEMAKVFSRNVDAAFGASIMLAVNRSNIPRLPAKMRTKHRLSDEGVDDGSPQGLLRFAGYRTEVQALDGLLILPADLALHNIPGDGLSKRTYPLITLPIRKQPKELVLPGAPTAILNDELSVYEDTSSLATAFCGAFSQPTREEIHTYFGPDGEGKDIRSIASIRIGTGQDPVGVLNIDANVTNVLGEDLDYYSTFYALLQPLLRLLEPLVRAYDEAWWTELDTNTETSPTTQSTSEA